MDMDFDNRKNADNILEVGYCYSGNLEVFSLPQNKKYTINKGDIFIYKTLNRVEYFKFKYNDYKNISIHMNFNTIKNVVNPLWEYKLVLEWEKNIDKIFKKDILIIEKASYDIKRISEDIDSLTISNIVDYMTLKLKTIEFLTTFLQEKSEGIFNKDIMEEESKLVISAKEIIDNNIESTPSIKELAENLNTSIYKLQKGFKNITGNTVYEYIKLSKLKRAKYLLKNSSMSIIEISNEIGYENPSKFSKVFKNYNNITPLKYRNSTKS